MQRSNSGKQTTAGTGLVYSTSTQSCTTFVGAMLFYCDQCDQKRWGGGGEEGILSGFWSIFDDFEGLFPQPAKVGVTLDSS